METSLARKFSVVLAVFIAFVSNASAATRSRPGHLPLRSADAREYRTHKTNDLFKSYLELSSFRHKIIAQNLANVNTPGYKADEVSMPVQYSDLAGSGQVVRKIGMIRTSNRHIASKKGAAGRFSSHKLHDPYEIKKNGNNVSLSQQIGKLSENKNDYAAVVKGYATTNSLFSSAIGK
ncbi:MAG: flagellar basal body rod protein FlgB [Rickettsiales bacterium]|nr:MAG: flagellar basal body rod protein FlgB [Rickettsiales bacterium]